MNIKEIEKEFEDEFVLYFMGGVGEGIMDEDIKPKELKKFIKKIANKIIDECIGEEITMNYNYREGYNMKVEELKKYKRIFNK